MQEIMLYNSKVKQKVYTMQDLLQDSNVMTSWNMRGTILKLQKNVEIQERISLFWGYEKNENMRVTLKK